LQKHEFECKLQSEILLFNTLTSIFNLFSKYYSLKEIS
jgi:hypothetical protein